MKGLINISRKIRPLTKFVARYSSTAPSTTLARHLAARIRSTGPLTVAEYMRESLIHPTMGYYSKKESFVGKDGSKDSSDFVTSPEMSAIFGELVAIWVIYQIQQQGLSGKTIDFIEFGPGTGTMMSDMLRTIAKVATASPETKANYNIHLVEASSRLMQVQREKLNAPQLAKDFPNIKWHDRYESPLNAVKGPAVFIGHEFFDALPIHKLQRVDGKDGKSTWREILVDLDETGADTNAEPKFRYVLARGPTPVSMTFSPALNDKRKQIEICPQAVRVVDRIARHLAAQKNGVALFADYGHLGDGEDTFRGYLKSKQHEPLTVAPGSCDLTADVDFSQLVAAVKKVPGVKTIGPINQREFLVNMGFMQRLDVLMRTCRQKGDADGRRRLLGQAEFLLSEKYMGERFKFVAIVPEKSHSMAGFSKLW